MGGSEIGIGGIGSVMQAVCRGQNGERSRSSLHRCLFNYLLAHVHVRLDSIQFTLRHFAEFLQTISRGFSAMFEGVFPRGFAEFLREISVGKL